jgi:hypothetical protein
MRGMEFDRKWGRAHKVEEKRATADSANMRRNLGAGWHAQRQAMAS